jgi:hypothetical protein
LCATGAAGGTGSCLSLARLASDCSASPVSMSSSASCTASRWHAPRGTAHATARNGTQRHTEMYDMHHATRAVLRSLGYSQHDSTRRPSAVRIQDMSRRPKGYQ